MLNEKAKNILVSLYQRDFNNQLDNLSTAYFGFEDNKEAAYYLKQLELKNLVKIPPNVFTFGGRVNSKFNNNVMTIYWEGIKLTQAGIQLIEEYMKNNPINELIRLSKEISQIGTIINKAVENEEDEVKRHAEDVICQIKNGNEELQKIISRIKSF
jgi:hypothetical protein